MPHFKGHYILRYKQDPMELSEAVKKGIQDIKKVPSIAKFLKFEDEQEAETVALEDVKSVDGTILRIEPAVEVGASVQVIDEAGELIAAPDGQIELEDGKLLNVEGGIIVEVQGVEGDEPAEEEMAIEEEPAPLDAAPAFDLEKLQKDIISKLNVAITEKIEKLRFASVEKVTALETENTDLKTVIVEMADILEKMAAEPSEAPKKEGRNPFAKNETFKNTSSLLRKN